jgi:hypothetical protein
MQPRSGLRWEETPMIPTHTVVRPPDASWPSPIRPARGLQRRKLLQRVITGGVATLVLGEPTDSLSAPRRTSTLDDASVTGVMLGAVSPLAAPGYRLQLVRNERPIGWFSSSIGRTGAIVCCVTSGELTIELQAGMAVVSRAQEAGEPSTEMLRLEEPVICRQNDCFSVDTDNLPTMYTAWNAGREPVALWEAYLSPIPLSRHWQCG